MKTEQVPQRLVDDLSANHLNGHWHESADTLGDVKGAYALLLGLGDVVKLQRPKKASGLLQPGWYIYTGNAHGPGGLAARVRRHFLKEKAIHWHVDQLTRRAVMMAAQIAPHGDECDITAWLSSSFAFDVVAPGFGSSDCRICPSHLLVWRPPDQRPV